MAVLRGIPAGIQYVPGIVLALGLGALTVQLLLWRYRRETELGTHCEVVLRGTEQTLCIEAIVDSGNTLTEPMSGAPVSVLDVVTFQTLWPEGLPVSTYRRLPWPPASSIATHSFFILAYLLCSVFSGGVFPPGAAAPRPGAEWSGKGKSPARGRGYRPRRSGCPPEGRSRCRPSRRRPC